MPFSGGELRSGIRQDQLRLLYQPLVSAHSSALHGVEALVRWQHPGRGLMGPDAFLPAIERNGLMAGLTDWVLEEALRQCAAWRHKGLVLPVSVNLSATLLADPGLVERVSGSLASCDVPAGMLTLEVTETALTQHPGSAAEIFTALRAYGMRISVDDFGTGYTSLAMLKDYTFDEVKIDRSFVDAMKHSPADEAIARAILELGHRLGLEVVGEGVEDAATVRLLAELGCDILQGYYFSRPLTADALTSYALKSAVQRTAGTAEEREVIGARNPVSGAVAAARPADEQTRLARLQALNVLDSAPDPVLDGLVKIAAVLCGTPTALLSFVDDERQWFKARIGLDVSQTPREEAFCAHAILKPHEIMEVADARIDHRFSTNPLVTGDPHIRFYAGSPMLTTEGHALGTLCVLDSAARTLDASQREGLATLSQMASRYLEARQAQRLMERLLDVINTLARMHSKDNLTAVCAEVTTAARDLYNATAAVLLFAEEPGSVRYRPIALSANKPHHAAAISDAVVDSRGASAMGVIRSTGSALFIADAATSPHVDGERARQVEATSILYIPVTDQTGVTGALVIWWDLPQSQPDHARTAAVNVLAAEVGATVSRLTAVAGVRDAGDTDPLTGLLNRRSFLATLNRLPDDSAVILLELHGLARTNNEYGHHMGDQLLKTFSAYLRASSRTADILSRWSGTKFAVALPGDAGGALEFTNRLLQSWTGTNAEATFSSGHIIPTHHEKPAAILTRVGKALQDANRISSPTRHLQE